MMTSPFFASTKEILTGNLQSSISYLIKFRLDHKQPKIITPPPQSKGKLSRVCAECKGNKDFSPTRQSRLTEEVASMLPQLDHYQERHEGTGPHNILYTCNYVGTTAHKASTEPHLGSLRQEPANHGDLD